MNITKIKIIKNYIQKKWSYIFSNRYTYTTV